MMVNCYFPLKEDVLLSVKVAGIYGEQGGNRKDGWN